MTKIDKERVKFEIRRYKIHKKLGLMDTYSSREIYLLKLLFRIYKSAKNKELNDETD